MELTKRRKIVYGIVGGVVLLMAIVAGIFWRPADPYRGLTTSVDIPMEDSMRTTFTQRLATAKAAIAAQEQTGETVTPELYLDVAENARFLGDLVTAREYSEHYLNVNALNYVVWNNYANILSRMGDLPLAEDAYQRAITVSGGEEEYYMDYVRFLEANYPERTDDVIAVLDGAVAQVGQSATLNSALAKRHLAAGECVAALANYRAAIALSPENGSLVSDYDEARLQCHDR